jgi:hypothetical protein
MSYCKCETNVNSCSALQFGDSQMFWRNVSIFRVEARQQATASVGILLSTEDGSGMFLWNMDCLWMLVYVTQIQEQNLARQVQPDGVTAHVFNLCF